MKKSDNPFPQCDSCKTLADCPHPDVGDNDGMSLPMIPDCCPRPMEIMEATLKKHKLHHRLIREN